MCRCTQNITKHRIQHTGLVSVNTNGGGEGGTADGTHTGGPRARGCCIKMTSAVQDKGDAAIACGNGTRPLPLGETKEGSVHRRNIATKPKRKTGKGKNGKII